MGGRGPAAGWAPSAWRRPAPGHDPAVKDASREISHEDEKNFELSRKSAVCLYGTWLAKPPRHHSPLVVVAPGLIAPVFFGRSLFASPGAARHDSGFASRSASGSARARARWASAC